MSGGLAVLRNLLCVSFTDARGRIVLVDLADRRPVAFFEWGGEASAYADAGGVAFDDKTTLFVADAENHVVRRFTIFGKEIGRIGQASEASPHAQGRDRVGVLNHPRAVAVDGDQVIVACGEGRLRYGVQRFTREGAVLAPLRSHGEPEGAFGAPRSVATMGGEILVADTLRGEVQRFKTGGEFVHSFACSRSSERPARPIAVAGLPDRSLVIALEGSGGGLLRTTALGERLAFVADETEGLEHPSALATSENGEIYVLDRHGERVQRWASDLRTGEVVLDLAEFLYGR